MAAAPIAGGIAGRGLSRQGSDEQRIAAVLQEGAVDDSAIGASVVPWQMPGSLRLTRWS